MQVPILLQYNVATAGDFNQRIINLKRKHNKKKKKLQV